MTSSSVRELSNDRSAGSTLGSAICSLWMNTTLRFCRRTAVKDTLKALKMHSCAEHLNDLKGQ